MFAAFFALLISMWTGAGYFIFVKLLLEPYLQKKRADYEFLFFRTSNGMLCGFSFFKLHLVCGAFFFTASGFALVTPMRCLIASTRRESAGEIRLLITCRYLPLGC